MIKIVRQVEIPREWTQERLKGMYPNYTLIGERSGWFYPVEETKVVFIAYNWRELVGRVEKHLKGNGIAISADLNLTMMKVFCEATKSEYCAEEDPNQNAKGRLFEQAQRFLRTINNVVASGASLVSQEEADRRASICAVCPQNQPTDVGCTGCGMKTAIAQMANFALGKSTPLDSQLHWCQVCGCKNSLKIWVDRESMSEKDLADKWETECWMRPGN